MSTYKKCETVYTFADAGKALDVARISADSLRLLRGDRCILAAGIPPRSTRFTRLFETASGSTIR